MSVNQPLFILDGFESTAERVMDLDMSRIESVTILKDASSKALYGSRASNGVIVIETKRMTGDDVRVTYTGNLDIEMPDLTSYNLTNSLEKLQVEVYEGLYDDASASPQTMVALRELYNRRLKAAEEGLNTDWLAKPLRAGIGQKHGISVELGRDALQCIADLQYKNVSGVMKGSERNTMNGSLNISYKTRKVTFRNIMSIASNKSYDSPYGSFSEYAKMNPYWSDKDEFGHIKRYVDTDVPNPMYDAEINTMLRTRYLDFNNNFYIEWQIFDGLKGTSRIGVETYRANGDTYYPARHSRFVNYSTEDELRKGSYRYSTTNRDNINGDIYLQYSKQIDKHLFTANGGFNLRQYKSDYLQFDAEGFPNDRIISITEARQYARNSVPGGVSTISREAGGLGLATYSYDNRYLADFTIRSNASSLFGKDHRWATFWSAGLGWNIHNETFMKGIEGLSLLKLRFSAGTSGNQNFLRNSSIAYYSYYKDRYYNGLTAAVLKNQGNPELKWEQTSDYNLGLDLKYKRLTLTADYYSKVTRGLIADIDIVPSTGFSTAKDNIGKVRNTGIEIKASYMVYQGKDGFLSVNGNIATNKNRLVRISESMRQYNDYQDKLAAERNNNRPVLRYVDGMPMNAIWAVPSLGIDPATGNEIYLDRDGNKTFEWKAENMVMAGSADPKYNGIAGLTGEYKGIGFNVTLTFLGGGKIYNQTLVDRVENIDPYYNVDKRVLSGRWIQPGQYALYKRLGTYRPKEGEGLAAAAGYTSNAYQEMTRATTRFVQKRNELNLSTISLYYDFPQSMIGKMKLRRLRAAVNMNDICTFSSVKIERGLDYPFARTVSFSLITTF